MNRYIKTLLALVCICGIYSCATHKPISSTASKPDISSERIISNINDVLSTEANLERRLGIDAGSMSVNGTLKINKDKRIWVNISMLGITFGRAMLTPDSLMYYERAQKTAFAGGWTDLYGISGQLKMVDYALMENLLLGRPIFELKPKNEQRTMAQDVFLFANTEPHTGANEQVRIDAQSFNITSQSITSPDGKIKLTAEYFYNNTDRLPISIIFTFAGDGERAVRLNYSPTKGTPNNDYPFRIPDGFSNVEELASKLFGTQ